MIEEIIVIIYFLDIILINIGYNSYNYLQFELNRKIFVCKKIVRILCIFDIFIIVNFLYYRYIFIWIWIYLILEIKILWNMDN